MDFGVGENLPTVKRTPMTLANPNKPEPNKITCSFRITSGLPRIKAFEVKIPSNRSNPEAKEKGLASGLPQDYLDSELKILINLEVILRLKKVFD